MIQNAGEFIEWNVFGNKKNEVVTQASKWMNLKNIMLSERNQSQKAIYCMIPFTENVYNRKTSRDKK